LWTFGDGATSTLQNPPPHTFATDNVADFTISLSESNVGGSSTKSVTVMVMNKMYLWKNRDGTSSAMLLKDFTGLERDMSAVPDASGGSVALGRESVVAVNNKGILTRLDVSGNEIWKIQIDSPLGNTFIPHLVTTDGSRIVVIYERLPLHDWLVYAYDMNGNGGLISETNIGYGLTSANGIIDGSHLLITRIQPQVPLPAPFPFSTTALIYASMISSDAPIVVEPEIDPQFSTVDAGGINVVGNGKYMKYARDLTVLQSPALWSTGINPVIHDVKTDGNATYIAGAVNGILTLTQIGNPAFMNTAGIPVGTDSVRLGFDSAGNLFVSVGSKIGRVSKTSGEITTFNPTGIPANVPWYISGNSVFFVSGGSMLYVLPLSQIP
jgi:PKD repeat protein